MVTTLAVFGGIPWAALKSLDVPILLWNAQQIRTADDGYTMVEIVRNTGQISTQALANTLVREGRWFRVVTGYENHPDLDTRLSRFFGIVRATCGIRTARLVAIGEIFPLMTDILIDEEQLQQQLGATVTWVSIDEWTRCYQDTRAE